MPLQSYFRINAQGMGQFERTLIVAEPNSEVQYIEGCTAAMYQKSMLHAAVVELMAKKGAKIQYITIQNWSKNVYNLVTKRAHAYEDASVTWLNGEVGSGQEHEVSLDLPPRQGTQRRRYSPWPTPARTRFRTPEARSSTSPPTPPRR